MSGFPLAFCLFTANKLPVRSVSNENYGIVTNRVKASNLAHVFLKAYKTNLEGVPRDSGMGGGGRHGTQINFHLWSQESHPHEQTS